MSNSNIFDIVKAVIDASPIGIADIARIDGESVQNVSNKVNGRNRADMYVAQAAGYLEHCGYELVAVPKGSKLPKGAYEVEVADE